MTREERKEAADMRDEYHRMEERVAALEDERDELREALNSIMDMAPPGAWDDTFHQAPSWWRAMVRNMHDAADKALQEAGDE